jgi:HAMP domain-containing protein
VKPAQPFRFRLKPRPGVRRRGRIAVALLAMLIGVGLVPLATMSWKLIGENRETLSTERQAYQLLLASSMAYELDLHVGALRSELLRVAQTFEAVLRRGERIPPSEIERILGQVTDARLAHLRYSYFRGDAVRSVEVGEYPEGLEPLFAATLRRAAEDHVRAPYSDAESRTFVSVPLPAEKGHPALLAVAAPVVADGAFRGVLTAMIDLDRVWRSVALRTDTGHLAFAVDERGEVFASSDPDRLAPGADVRDWAIVANFLDKPEATAGLITPFGIERGGEVQRFTGVHELTRQGWGIFVQARDEDVYWVVGAMVRNARTLTLILLGVVVIGSAFFARLLSQPISSLASAARALAGGDLSARADVRSRTEIGELADTFNGMAEVIENQARARSHP